MNKRAWGLSIGALAFLVSAPLLAQLATLRLATIVPENSPWVDALKSMGQSWERATEKRVRLRFVPGQTSEPSIVTRMGTGGLEAAALSAVGLADIDEAFNVLGIPFFFESDAELAHVLEKLTPVLSGRLAAKRLRLVLWGHAGWVQLFSKMPIRAMTDLQRAKLFTSEGNPKTVQWYTANGFNAVPLQASEIPKQLKLPTGAIDAAPATPPYALSLQFYRDAPYMLDIRVGPLVAAVVVADAAWNRLSASDRERMLEIAKQSEQRLFAEAAGLDAKHVREMQASGLKVVTLEGKAATEFRATAAKMAASQSGSLVPKDVYDLAVRERDAYRKTKSK
jgi:TRAP-type C4-dicarboxylate transport system substrate-binding protein